MNKILYSLAKIDYHKAKLLGEQNPKNVISKLFFVLQSYKEIDIDTIMRITKLSKDEVIKGLQYLNAIGLADWRGLYLTDKKNKTVTYTEKGDLIKFIQELEVKIAEMEGKKVPTKIEIPEDEKECNDQWVEVQYNPDVILRIRKSKLKELM